MNTITAAITAVGAYLPEYVLTNQILETMVDTNDEWITERTGIKERRHRKNRNDSEETTAFLAKKAAEKAKEKGLEVLETRFQDFHSNEKFDFIIAISSLIHIPRNDIPNQLNRISSFLKKEGLAFITFLEGTEEGYDDPTQIGNQRFFSKFFY